MRNLHSVPRSEPLWDFTAIAQQSPFGGVGLGITPEQYRRAIEGGFLNTQPRRFPIRESIMPLGGDLAADVAPVFWTYEATDRAFRILRDLMRTADEMRQSRMDRSPYASLRITGREWNVLRVEMSQTHFRDYFGLEGAEPTFMGLPIYIDFPY